MSSSFTIDAVSAEFDVTETGYADKGGPLEEFVCKIVVADPTAWGALFSLRSWNVNQRPIPKRVGQPSKVLVQVGGGAGEGTLAIEGLDPKTAILSELSSDPPESDGNRRLASAMFVVTGTP